MGSITKTFIKSLLLTSLLATLTSCQVGYYININQDGSTYVQTTPGYEWENTIERLDQSNVITSFDTIEGRLYFKTKNIDSLGTFLPILSRGYFQFNLKDSLLTIKETDTIPLRTEHSSCCSMNMTLKFSQDIRVLNESKGKFKVKNDNRIIISKTRRQLLKGIKRTELIIKIKTSE